MRYIRIFAVLAAMLALAAPAQAQGGGGQGGRARAMEMLMQGITLTDAQKVSVDSIGQVFRAQMPTRLRGVGSRCWSTAPSASTAVTSCSYVRGSPGPAIESAVGLLAAPRWRCSIGVLNQRYRSRRIRS